MLTKTDIEQYFTDTKKESRVWISIGILSVLTGVIYFFFLVTDFYRGAVFPLVLAGIGWIFAGYRVLRTCDELRIRNVYAVDMNPSDLQTAEIPRMKNRLYGVVRWYGITLFLLTAGVALYIYFIRDIANDRWRGMGLALIAVALIQLMLLYFAWKRDKHYLGQLQENAS